MAYITTPLAVDPTQPASVLYPRDNYRNYGPISFGGALWCFTIVEVFTVSIPFPDGKVGVYKSVDSGVTWVRQDLANAPSSGGTPGDPLVYCGHYWDGSSATVTIVYTYPVVSTIPLSPTPVTADTDTGLSLVDFNMSTGFFGVPYAAHNFYLFPPGSPGGAPFAALVNPSIRKLSSGKIRFVYTYLYLDNQLTEAQAQVYYADFASGTWGSPQVLPGNTVAYLIFNYLDSAVQQGDVLHVFYSRSTDFGVTYSSAYVQIDATGAFSTPVDTTSLNVTTLQIQAGTNFLSYGGTAIISGNAILQPVLSLANNSIGVMRGTPLSAPTFSFVSVSPPVVFINIFQMLHIAGKDVLMWCDGSNTRDQFLIRESDSADGGVTWSAAATVMSLVANPPTPVSGVSADDLIFIQSLSLGSLGASVGLMFSTWATYYAASTSPPPPSVTVNCSISIS